MVLEVIEQILLVNHFRQDFMLGFLRILKLKVPRKKIARDPWMFGKILGLSRQRSAVIEAILRQINGDLTNVKRL
jgi:hypothetical protein